MCTLPASCFSAVPSAVAGIFDVHILEIFSSPLNKYYETRYVIGLQLLLTVCVGIITFSFNAQWLLYVPPGLILRILTLCPQNEVYEFRTFFCSEQTAIISLYTIHWLTSITETECVYCAVRAESSNTIQLCHVSGCSYRWPVKAAVLSRSQVSPSKVLLDKVALGNVFLRVLRFFPPTTIPPMSHTDFHPHAFPSGRTNGRCLGTFSFVEVKQISFRQVY